MLPDHTFLNEFLIKNKFKQYYSNSVVMSLKKNPVYLSDGCNNEPTFYLPSTGIYMYSWGLKPKEKPNLNVNLDNIIHLYRGITLYDQHVVPYQYKIIECDNCGGEDCVRNGECCNDNFD